MNATSASSDHDAPGIAPITVAKFGLGDVVRHRILDFRGVIFDIDPVFANSEEWYQSIPADMRPRKDQPFYHLFAENDDSTYVAYVSQQNLIGDSDAGPVGHPAIEDVFEGYRDGQYRLRPRLRH
jgi:heat shock protein HspQ